MTVGSTGPSSINPETGEPYGTTFPLLSVFDMVNAQFLLLDHLGIDKLYATVGSSLGKPIPSPTFTAVASRMPSVYDFLWVLMY